MAIYFIDGYNVIHHSARLRPLVRDNFEAARDSFIVKVGHFCASSGEHARIFFDGRGQRSQPMLPECRTPGLEIIYSPSELSADSLIERRIYEATNRRDIIVVSADRGIRELCRGMGALVMGSENFLQRVYETLDETSQHISSQRQKQDRPRIEDRLDAATLDRLTRLRDTLSGRG